MAKQRRWFGSGIDLKHQPYCEESSLFPWWFFSPFNQKKTQKKEILLGHFHPFFLCDFPSLLVFSLRKSPNQPKTRSANANTSSSKAKSLYHIATIPYTTVIVEFKWTLRAFNFQWFNQWLVNLPRATYPSQINRALRENQRLKSPQIRPYFRGGRLTSHNGWTNPSEKISSSNWIISPGMKIANIWN